MNGNPNTEPENYNDDLQGISMSDGSEIRNEIKTDISYIDELVNDENDIAEIKKAQERIMTPADRRVIRLLAALNVAVVCFLGVYMLMTDGGNAYSSAKGKSAFNMKTPYYDVAEVFSDELKPNLNAVKFEPKVGEKFKPLLSRNEDTVGWVAIEGTKIDYVVVQSDDNDYYERRDFNKDHSVEGIIFMDYRNNTAGKAVEFSKNTVLYGHRVPYDGSMFTSIENYTDIEYYKQHPTIKFDTVYGDFTWKIIGAFINYPNSTGEGEDLFYYWYTDFCDQNTVAFANEVASRSYFINPSVDVRPTDKFLTLSTCSYLISKSGSVKGRFVVVARLVRNGESVEVDTDRAYVNETQRMPALWYTSRGEKDPYKNVPVWNAY